MTTSPLPGQGAELVDRLLDATNAHDLDAVAACFAADYRNETPVHPARSFTGRDQVRRNWDQILTFVPDLRAAVLRASVEGEVVWSEWEMQGTRRDGTRHHMRGVIIFGVRHEAFAWARFYLEPVEDGGGGVDAAVRTQVMPSAVLGRESSRRR